MDISVTVFSEKNAAGIVESLESFELPIWNINRFVDRSFEHYLLLVAQKHSQVKGVWHVPLIREKQGWSIARTHRIFPYMSPTIFSTSRLHQRNIVIKMIEALQERVISIDIPISPDFTDINAAFARGCFAEWRHTHCFSRQDWERAGVSQFDEKIRNHIRKARQTVNVQFSRDASLFDFAKAIRGSDVSIVARMAFAKMLLDEQKAYTGIATDMSSGKVLGGVYLVESAGTMMLYHSWFEKEGARGVPSLLIEQAIGFSFLIPGIKKFDFEGSILASVDLFMSGFNAAIVPYAYLYWSRDENQIAEFVRSSLNIQGRSEI